MSKNIKMRFFLISQGSLDQQIRFPTQKMWSVARVQRHGQTDTKVNTEGTLSGFQDFFLQPIIKDRPNKHVPFITPKNLFLYFHQWIALLYYIFFFFFIFWSIHLMSVVSSECQHWINSLAAGYNACVSTFPI